MTTKNTINYFKVNKGFIAVSMLVVISFIVFGGITYSKELKQVRSEKKEIDSIYKSTLRNYKQSPDIQRKLDSLKSEIKTLKNFNDAKIRYIYINSNFDDKYKLLTERIQNDSI